MTKDKKKKYQFRAFLNKKYGMAAVELQVEPQARHPIAYLSISDCNRKITLEFDSEPDDYEKFCAYDDEKIRMKKIKTRLRRKLNILRKALNKLEKYIDSFED